MVCPLVQILWVRWPFSYLVCSDTNTFIYFCILYLLTRVQGTAKGFLDRGRPDKVWDQSTEGRRDKSAASCQQLNDNHSNWTSFSKVAWSRTHRSSTTPYHSKKLILASCVVARKKLRKKTLVVNGLGIISLPQEITKNLKTLKEVSFLHATRVTVINSKLWQTYSKYGGC